MLPSFSGGITLPTRRYMHANKTGQHGGTVLCLYAPCTFRQPDRVAFTHYIWLYAYAGRYDRRLLAVKLTPIFNNIQHAHVVHSYIQHVLCFADSACISVLRKHRSHTHLHVQITLQVSKLSMTLFLDRSRSRLKFVSSLHLQSLIYLNCS